MGLTLRKLASITAVAAILGGCGGETTQTVEWYKTHDAERQEKLAECKNNPGEMRSLPNCINAKQAQKEVQNARRGFIQPPGFNPKKNEG